jgi:hypothetical protein
MDLTLISAVCTRGAGTWLHGSAGAILGPRLTICLGGLLTLAGAALITVAAPQLWRYQRIVIG